MAKKQRIVFEPQPNDRFMVVRLVNTLRYQIGEIVDRSEVFSLARAPNVEVVVQPSRQ